MYMEDEGAGQSGAGQSGEGRDRDQLTLWVQCSGDGERQGPADPVGARMVHMMCTADFFGAIMFFVKTMMGLLGFNP